LQEGSDHSWAKVVVWNDTAYEASYAPASIVRPGSYPVTYILALRNDNHDRQAETHVFTYTLDPALTYVNCRLALGDTPPVEETCGPDVNGAAHTWSVTLQPGVSATFVMTTSVDVAWGAADTLNTVLAHADGASPVATQAFHTEVRPYVWYFPSVH
jgi:hypothetical protein